MNIEIQTKNFVLGAWKKAYSFKAFEFPLSLSFSTDENVADNV